MAWLISSQLPSLRWYRGLDLPWRPSRLQRSYKPLPFNDQPRLVATRSILLHAMNVSRANKSSFRLGVCASQTWRATCASSLRIWRRMSSGPPRLLEKLCYQPSPSRLVTSTHASTGFSVKILEEENFVIPNWILLKFGHPTVNRPVAFRVL